MDEITLKSLLLCLIFNNLDSNRKRLEKINTDTNHHLSHPMLLLIGIHILAYRLVHQNSDHFLAHSRPISLIPQHTLTPGMCLSDSGNTWEGSKHVRRQDGHQCVGNILFEKGRKSLLKVFKLLSLSISCLVIRQVQDVMQRVNVPEKQYVLLDFKFKKFSVGFRYLFVDFIIYSVQTCIIILTV